MNKRVEKLIIEKQWGCSKQQRKNIAQARHSGKSGDLYAGVPKELEANLKFRQKLVEECYADPLVGEAVKQYCRDDILFFINAFCWVYEPRSRDVIPFITWDFQDGTIIDILNNLGEKDVLLEKSRDMGASWMVLTIFFWQWCFHPYSAMGLVSRTEDAVDKSDDPDTLMWKLDFHFKNLPSFLQPNLQKNDRSSLKFKQPENESTIVGYSATGDVARGGRKLAFMMDELAAFKADDGYAAYASTQHVTDSRIMLSTPQGAAGIFYEVANAESPDIEVITLPWFLHPYKSRGLYRSKRNVHGRYELEVLDKEEEYEYILDGKIRSPWYDKECRRSPVQRLIAQELDIDYSGSGSQFYDSESLKHGEDTCMEPFHTGDLDFVPEVMEPEWLSVPNGRLKIWAPLVNGVPPQDRRYVIGCDIASGKGGPGSTNHAAVVIDITTGFKVAEFACNDISVVDYARYVRALGRFFKGLYEEAYLIWEDNGPGGAFGSHVIEFGYAHYFMRTNESNIKKKKTFTPGWWSTPQTKLMLLSNHAKALASGDYTERSTLCINECKDYVYSGQKVVHQKSLHSEDPAHGGDNHGDRVIATAVAWRGVMDRPAIKLKKTPTSDLAPPPYSFAARRKKHLKRKEQELSW